MSASAPLEAAWADERLRIVAYLARRFGDLALAEDCVQDAFAAAAVRWPSDGIPDRPGAWLTTTARRKAVDALRRSSRLIDAESHVLDRLAADAATAESSDDIFAMLLACCHPALSVETRVALTLRHVAGLAPRQIAASFLISEQTLEKRLVRGRMKIRESGIRLMIPDVKDLEPRLSSVRAVIYLIFTEGHHATVAGEAIRTELCDEAIWLAEQLDTLRPKDDETVGLLALLVLLRARAASRLDEAGTLRAPSDHDPTEWDARAIERARSLLGATSLAPVGPYQLQAAIALMHCSPAIPAATRNAHIARLYESLQRITPSPVVLVNLSLAVAARDDADAGLRRLEDALADTRVRNYAPLHAAHAELLDRAGRTREAQDAWKTAADLSRHPSQRERLNLRAATG